MSNHDPSRKYDIRIVTKSSRAERSEWRLFKHIHIYNSRSGVAATSRDHTRLWSSKNSLTLQNGTIFVVVVVRSINLVILYEDLIFTRTIASGSTSHSLATYVRCSWVYRSIRVDCFLITIPQDISSERSS